MFSCNSLLNSAAAPTKLAIHSVLGPGVDPKKMCGDNFKKTASIVELVQLIDELKRVTYVHFDSGATFYREHVKWKQKTF